MNDKEKLEAIEKIINKKAEKMDDLPWSKREKTNKLLGGIKQSEYEKILKHTVTEFFDEFEIFLMCVCIFFYEFGCFLSEFVYFLMNLGIFLMNLGIFLMNLGIFLMNLGLF